MDLPKVLEDMLRVVMDTNTLRSWNIHQDINGCINFNLKFGGHQESVTHIRQASYRKKTNRQVQRDLERSRLWRAGQQSTETIAEPTAEPTEQALSYTDHPRQSATQLSNAVGVRTRAMTKNVPELVRAPSVEPETPLNPQADSFVMPCSTPTTSLASIDATDTSLNVSISSHWPHRTT